MCKKFNNPLALLSPALLLACPPAQAAWGPAKSPAIANGLGEEMIVRLVQVPEEGEVKVGWSTSPATAYGPEWAKELRPARRFPGNRSYVSLARDESNVRFFLDNPGNLPKVEVRFRVETAARGVYVAELGLTFDSRAGTCSSQVLSVFPGWEAGLDSDTLTLRAKGRDKSPGVEGKHEAALASATPLAAPAGAGQERKGLEFPLAGMFRNASTRTWIVKHAQDGTKRISGDWPLLDRTWDELPSTGTLEVIQFRPLFSETQNQICSFVVQRADDTFWAALAWAPDPTRPDLPHLRVVEYMSDRTIHKVAEGMVLAPGEPVQCQGSNLILADAQPELGLGLRKAESVTEGVGHLDP